MITYAEAVSQLQVFERARIRTAAGRSSYPGQVAMTAAIRHTLDIYDADLHLVTTPAAWTQLRKTLDHLDAEVPDSAGLVQFSTFEPDDGTLNTPVLVIWINQAQHADTLQLIDTVAHEATHAAGELLEHIGHQIKGTDEPHAYLVGWITRWILGHLGVLA